MSAPWKREEVIGPCRLLLGDCREILPTLSGIDIFITSPPYNLGNTPESTIGAKFSGGKSRWRAGQNHLANGYGIHTDDMPLDEYEDWQRGMLRLMWKALTDEGAIFYNHKPRPRDRQLWLPLVLLGSLPLRQIIIWARNGGINFSPCHYMSTHEWLMLIAKPGFEIKSRAASGVGDVWYMPFVTDNPHPAPFPVALPSRVLETTAGATVCDPYMGSGTVGLGCIRHNRRFIGIELEPKWFDLACRRIERELRQGCLLRDLPMKPEQTSLLDAPA